MAALSSWLQARACMAVVSRRPGIIAWVLQCAARGGSDVKTWDKYATDRGSLRCTWTHKRTAPAGPGSWCEGVFARSTRRRSASSSVRRGGPEGGSSQGHVATWEHCAHLVVPVGTAEDTVSRATQSWQSCER